MRSIIDRIAGPVLISSIVALGLGAAVLITGQAGAHEAPTGWSYPLLCCSSIDCREAADREVRETVAGYQVASTGEVVPYGHRRIKDSPDGRFHLCQQGGDFDKGRVLCLFVPPRGM